MVAEKPSVARAIKKTLRKHGVEAQVVGLRGHILDSDLPEGYGWGRVDPAQILQLREFRTQVRDEEVYRELEEIFREDVEELVIATDNDSEGELIGWEVLELYRRLSGGGRISRMRFNTVSEEELWRAWQSRESDLNWRWVWKAAYRRDFDLATGAAFTRLLTTSARRKGYRALISWGSCQTPTLNYLVEREERIRRFKPEPYWLIRARLKTESGEVFEAASQRIDEKDEAERLLREARRAEEAVVEDYGERVERVRRPTPLRTDNLLRDLHKITGIPASQILRTAEELYSEGYISYPRTETNKWPRDFDFRSPALAAVEAGLAELGAIDRDVKPLNGRLDDKAHPPIYPVKPYLKDGSRRWRVWEYVARRFLANAYWSDAEILRQRTAVRLKGLRLKATGGRIKVEGFYEVYPYFRPRVEPIPRLRKGEKLEMLEVKLVEEWTKPPSRLTEAELLKLMERDRIGTDATRADYPRIIVDRGYAVRIRKTLKPTELGMTLVRSLRSIDGRLVSPQTRRTVEEYMEKIAAGGMEYGEALDETLKLYSELYRRLEERVGAIAGALARSVSEVWGDALQGQKGRGAKARGAPQRGSAGALRGNRDSPRRS